MRLVRRAAWWLSGILAVLIVALAALFGLARTPFGRDFLAQAIAGLASRPGFSLSIEGLGGDPPFRMTAAKITLGDSAGAWLTSRGLTLDLSPGALFAGRVDIRSLSAREIEIARLPRSPGPAAPLAGRLELPRLPVALAIQRFVVERLALAPSVLGEPVIATIAGHAAFGPATAQAALDIHRTDGEPGKLTLALGLAGKVLSLRLVAREPTGILADRLLRRTDHLPLSLSLDGKGLLADWRGRFAISAGALAHAEAELRLAAKRRVVAALTGQAVIAGLFPAKYAALIGKRVPLSLRAVLDNGAPALAGSLDMAAGRISVEARLAADKKSVATHFAASAPRLALFAGLLGEPIEGSAALSARLGGTVRQPRIAGKFSGSAIRVGGLAADRLTARFTASRGGGARNSQIAIAAEGRADGVAVPAGIALPASLGRDIAWSLAANLPRAGGGLDLTKLSLRGMGIALAGAGRVGAGAKTLAGRLDLSIADLRPFSAVIGHPIAGAAMLALDAERQGKSGFRGRLSGSARGLKTGEAAADALFGGTVAIAASGGRDAAGEWVLDRLELTGPGARISGHAVWHAAADRLAAALRLDVPRLAPIGKALGVAMAGNASANFSVTGAPAHLAIDGKIAGDGLTVAGRRFSRLRLAAKIADLAKPAAKITGEFAGGGLDGTVDLVARPAGPSEFSVPRLHLAAAGGAIDGRLAVALDKGVVTGVLDGRVADLAAWSKLAEEPLAGSLSWTARLAARNGQGLALDIAGNGLRAGPARVGRLAFSGWFGDLWGQPTGRGRLTLAAVKFAAESLAAAHFSFASRRAGQFLFDGAAKGRPLALAFAGELGLGRGSEELRIARLSGSLDRDPIRLRAPFALRRRGPELRLSGLDLALGAGRITGNAAISDAALSLALDAANLPLAPIASLAGYPRTRGAVSLEARLGGTLSAPRGHAAVRVNGLGFALAQARRAPPLGLTVNADWNGRDLALDGRLAAAKGNTLALRGRLPLALTRAPLGISLPPQGALALRVSGSGNLASIADLLPIGEDRIAGAYAIDISAGGTIADPAASGRLTLSDGRYENYATGAVLSDINAEIRGDRRHLTLLSLSAGDGEKGRLTAKGSFSLATASADIAATLSNFRVAASDEALATATGSVAVTGPLAAPRIKADLTAERADLTIPDSLPPNVTRLDVVVVGNRRGKAPRSAGQAARAATLDIRLNLPGRVFVRGHGLDSEWRGHLTIDGTTAAPRVAGTLRQIRGSFGFLGKSFQLVRGTIAFDNSARIDPTLDILAEATASDITARVHIGGAAQRPKLTLSSTPPLPQDEILSRVLFNQGVGRITPGQGVELANAAATLAGGGPDVIGRLRRVLGLDWLGFGSGPGGVMSNIVTPAPATASATGSTTLSGGKSVAPGVSVGVSQGLSPPTSKVTVQVAVRPHVSVETDLGSAGGSGIGVFYKFDY